MLSEHPHKRLSCKSLLILKVIIDISTETWNLTWSVEIWSHYNDIIMSTMASQITSLTIVYSIVYSGADQRKHQSSASLAFVRGIHRWPVDSPHKGPVTRKTFPFDDVIIEGVVQGGVRLVHFGASFQSFKPGTPFTNMLKSLIPTWISNHLTVAVWDEITYPFPNFNGCTIEVWEWRRDIYRYLTWKYWCKQLKRIEGSLTKLHKGY